MCRPSGVQVRHHPGLQALACCAAGGMAPNAGHKTLPGSLGASHSGRSSGSLLQWEPSKGRGT